MKTIKFLLLFIISLFLHNHVFSNNKVQASFQYAIFNSPNDGPFVETYLTVLGNTSTFVLNENDKYQSSIEITMIFKQEGKVVKFSKNVLLSPEIEDSLAVKPNFIDQQRFSLANGIYNMEIIIKDLGAGSEDFSFNDIITVNIEKDKVCFSGVQFIDKYYETKTINILSKNGYDLVPYVANYFPDNMSSIIFYTEVYNIKSVIEPDQEFLLRYYIQNSYNKKALDAYSRIRKQKAEDVNIIFSTLDITDLQSGNYDLVIEIKDKNNKIIKDQKVFFQRSNPEKDFKMADIDSINIDEIFSVKYTNIDTLKEYFRSIRPIANDVEKSFIDNQLKTAEIEYLQRYFYGFWVIRNSYDPEHEWEKFKKQVAMVNELYSSHVFKGYTTDRGWVYLKYGAPNHVSECKHEPNTFPYEIWHYYHLGEDATSQENIKFVFYNPNIAGNDYTLLHSNARGEISNKAWISRLFDPKTLNQYNERSRDIDRSNIEKIYGSKALELWNE